MSIITKTQVLMRDPGSKSKVGLSDGSVHKVVLGHTQEGPALDAQPNSPGFSERPWLKE